MTLIRMNPAGLRSVTGLKMIAIMPSMMGIPSSGAPTLDADADGFGNSVFTTEACIQPFGFVAIHQIATIFMRL